MKFSLSRLPVFPSSRLLVFAITSILLTAQAAAQVVHIPDINLEHAIRNQLNLERPTLPPDEPITQQDMLQLVHIPDINLEHAIRNQLNLERPTLPPDEPITQQDMLQLTWLDGRGKNITDLTGLEYATNLTHLYFVENKIENVEPLAGLIHLWLLDLHLNQIQDITPLANLVNLQKLYIHENLVTDITPIQALNLIEFKYDEICDMPPTLPPVRERIKNRNFPSVFQAWDHVLGLDHLTPDQRAALHDLHFTPWFYLHWDQTPTEPTEGLATSLAGILERGRDIQQLRLDLNPNMIFLKDILIHAHFTEEAFSSNSDFWLKNENGDIARDGDTPLINFLKPEVQDLIVKRVIAVERCGLYDGVMFDGFSHNATNFIGRNFHPSTDEEIIQAIINILNAIRAQVRDDFLILINANRTKATRYTEYVNGTFMETLTDAEIQGLSPGGYTHQGLTEIESTLIWSEENLREPQINCLEGWGIPTEPPDSPDNRRWMRVFTTMSLIFSDGYVLYNTGDRITPNHQHIWYSFWDADLDQPLNPTAQPYQNIEGLFIRKFTNGWAVYNRSGTPQTITLPASATPVSDRGNNAESQTHLLPDLDGEIYLKAKNPADVNGDGEVNILDLVHLANNFGKSDPDLNGDGVVNILDLVLVSQHFN